MKKREENWNHLNVKRDKAHKAYEAQISRISYNLGTKLTGEQHTALMVLAHYRHCIHSARESYNDLTNETKEKLRSFFLNKMNVMMRTAHLPEVNIRYFMVDSLKSDKLRTAYIDRINENIEEYLDNMDRTYGTMYCPTGYRRAKFTEEAMAAEM